MLELRSRLSQATLALLETLPTVQASGVVAATHACLDHPTAHIENAYDAEMQLLLCGEDFLVVGHSHRAFAYLEGVSWIHDPLDADAVTVPDRAVICPGSLIEVEGAPASYCLLDTETRLCSWHSIVSSTAAPLPEVVAALRPTR